MYTHVHLGTTLPVRRTVQRKCLASKFNQELRQTVQRYGVLRTQIFTIYAKRSVSYGVWPTNKFFICTGRSGVKVRLNF